MAERQAKVAAKVSLTVSCAVGDFSSGSVGIEDSEGDSDSEEDSAADLLETARQEEEEKGSVSFGVCSVSVELEDQEEVEEVDQVVELHSAHYLRHRQMSKKLVSHARWKRSRVDGQEQRT